MFYAIWYHLYNLKNVKNTHEGVLLLVKVAGLKLLNTPPRVFCAIQHILWMGIFNFFSVRSCLFLSKLTSRAHVLKNCRENKQRFAAVHKYAKQKAKLKKAWRKIPSNMLSKFFNWCIPAVVASTLMLFPPLIEFWPMVFLSAGVVFLKTRFLYFSNYCSLYNGLNFWQQQDRQRWSLALLPFTLLEVELLVFYGRY